MKKCLALCCALLLLTGCSRTQEPARRDLFAMDTVISLEIDAGGDADAAFSEAAALLAGLENALSVTKAESEVAQVNAQGGGVLSEETAALLRRSLTLSEETGGAFSPALYTLTSLWGFTTDVQRVPQQAEIDAALAGIAAGGVTLSGNTVELDGVQLDFGAAAKGYAAQKIADAWTAEGVTAAVLSLGGNVQTIGEKPDGTPWRIGIRDPHSPEDTLGVLSLRGAYAVVTSGGYQRYFEEDGVRYSHILDPKTGYPAKSGLDSVTIVAQDGFLADGLSTALYVMGLEEARTFYRSRSDFEMVLVTENGEIFVSEGLENCLEGADFTVITR